MARAESRHIVRLLFHPRQHRVVGDIRARSGWTGRVLGHEHIQQDADVQIGTIMGIL